MNAHFPPADFARADDLRGKTILIAEDELLIGFDLVTAFEAAGATVLGPIATVRAAFGELDRAEQIDAAVLDVNLQGEMVYSFARELDRLGIPFVFHSGAVTLDVLNDRFAGAPVCTKPSAASDILQQTVTCLAAHGALLSGADPA